MSSPRSTWPPADYRPPVPPNPGERRCFNCEASDSFVVGYDTIRGFCRLLPPPSGGRQPPVSAEGWCLSFRARPRDGTAPAGPAEGSL